MAKITDKADLNVATELVIDESLRTIQLVATGNLVAKDGVTIQALYSKLVDLWATSTYQDSPFPMNALDALSGQYQMGIDAGGNANGWVMDADASRQMLRDGGWEEYDDAGLLLEIYAGIVGLGTVSTGSQLYYQRAAADAPTDFTFDDQANEGIKVYSDASSEDFDKTTFFKAFCREQGKLYTDSVLADTGKTATGAFIVNMLLSNADDLKISDDDVEMTNAPYNGITVTYESTPVSRNIGGSDYDFSVIIDGNGATLEEIYTKVQYLLRQATDIDENVGGIIGKTADVLCFFVGDTLETTQGVYIDDIQAADSNRIVFTDDLGDQYTNPFEAAGIMNFNSVMVGAGSSYRMMYTTGPGAGDDYGESGAITVLDASDVAITGTIASASIPFTFDYDGDSAGGPVESDKGVTLIGLRPGSSKFAVTTGTLTRSKSIVLALVAEADRAYL